jgi:NNP family nitrate/nitrite transporter-like MFS transporter
LDTSARRVRRLQICIFIAYAIAFALPNFAQYQLMPLATRLMEELSLTRGQFTSIFSAPMIPAIFLSLICGVLVDKCGYKYVIAASIILTAIGIFGRIFASNYTQLYICMILLGTSSGFVTATGSKIIGSFFEMKRVGVIVGYAVTIGTATMIIASATTAMMSTRAAFIIAAVFVTVDLIAWFVLAPRNKDVLIKGAAAENAPSIGKCLATVLKNKYVWFVAIGLFCVNGAMVGMNSLISAALVSRGMTETGAGAISSFTLVGNLIGSLVVPTLAAKTGKTRLVLIIFSLIAALGTAFAWLSPFGFALYAALVPHRPRRRQRAAPAHGHQHPPAGRGSRLLRHRRRRDRHHPAHRRRDGSHLHRKPHRGQQLLRLFHHLRRRYAHLRPVHVSAPQEPGREGVKHTESGGGQTGSVWPFFLCDAPLPSYGVRMPVTSAPSQRQSSRSSPVSASQR